MSKLSILVLTLVVTLVVSNGWWVYQWTLVGRPSAEAAARPTVFEEERSLQRSLQMSDRAAVKAMAAIAASAAPGSTRQSIVAAVSRAERNNQDLICMEDPDVVDADGLGLKFDSDGKLVGATRVFCPM